MAAVVVADTELLVLEVLGMALEAEGHQVVKVVDAAELRHALVATGAEVVICSAGIVDALIAIRTEAALAHLRCIALTHGHTHLAGFHVLARPIVLRQLLALVADGQPG